jgi:putative MATE family efflux protein
LSDISNKKNADSAIRGAAVLGSGQILPLIVRFSVPAVIGMLVGSLYNIVDQIFIGQKVGVLGNAATNVAFPLVTICMAVALLIGIGTATNYSLELGRGNKERAAFFAGNGIALNILCGICIAVLAKIFIIPLLHVFGATDTVFPYAKTYTAITIAGIPFLLFGVAGNNLVRADGAPATSMLVMLAGAVANIFLDALFMYGFDWGIAGAAWATVISQILSAVLLVIYLFHIRSVKLNHIHFKLSFNYIKLIAYMGFASAINQIAMASFQIVMNNVLVYYGKKSVYGSDIPLACVGVITKINMLLMGIVIGISQGCQPIFGFNYGAKKYHRVKAAYKYAAVIATAISVTAWICFLLFPRQITALFGNGSELYFHFAEQYFRIFMVLTFLNGIQPLTSNFFASIGKAKLGAAMSLTRQVLFLIPLIVILPLFFGIDGVLYAGPAADCAAFIFAVTFVSREMHTLTVNDTPIKS